jgi:hypothetical protein
VAKNSGCGEMQRINSALYKGGFQTHLLPIPKQDGGFGFEPSSPMLYHYPESGSAGLDFPL